MTKTHNMYPLAEERRERDGAVVVWENPDIPGHENVLGERFTFFCPNDTCGDELIFEGFNNRDQLIAVLEDENGTMRCQGCQEPIYGIFGDGDHD